MTLRDIIIGIDATGSYGGRGLKALYDEISVNYDKH
jgi:hypothetical protein